MAHGGPTSSVGVAPFSVRGFDPAKHPHRPKGAKGGQWAPKAGGGEEGGAGGAKRVKVTASMLAGHLVDEDGNPIGPEDTIVVYHATTEEAAADLVKNGIEPGAKKAKAPTLITDATVAAMLHKKVGDPLDYEPGRGIGAGTYVSADTVQADTFGPAIVGVRVKVSDLEVPPERPKSTPVKALLNNDGYLTKRIPPEDVFVVRRKTN